MIYTVTFNPALDYAVGVKDLKLGMTNRTSFEQFLPGGKGLNVSTILTNLGLGNIALGFIAGFIAGYMQKRDYAHAFKMGLSCGSASAFSELLAAKEEIDRVYNSFELL